MAQLEERKYEIQNAQDDFMKLAVDWFEELGPSTTMVVLSDSFARAAASVILGIGLGGKKADNHIKVITENLRKAIKHYVEKKDLDDDDN